MIALADSAGLSVGIIADSEPLMCSMSQSFGLRGRVLKDSQRHLSCARTASARRRRARRDPNPPPRCTAHKRRREACSSAAGSTALRTASYGSTHSFIVSDHDALASAMREFSAPRGCGKM